MAVLFSPPMFHYKRRRTATSVFAGCFDPIPERDVLTSLLNGVGPNKELEAEEELYKAKKRKEARKRHDASLRRSALIDPTVPQPAPPVASSSKPLPAQQEPKKKKTFWTARPGRPNIQLMPIERSVSVTPPPGYLPVHLPSNSPIPRRSLSTSTSRTSSKRPRTPADHEDIEEAAPQPMMPPPKKERKKRFAHKKGWKGWIEGDPAPSDRLINLDAVLVFQDRRTRSGKSFDAISVGTDTWEPS